ncbi:unnamed protein product [Pleuronectes platessa]|uniref:Uncharacterized protein n=1 Tax=Pleuronectes platessa TaxID=8262 RepID=A0A9N7U0B7_PLEPL|nr:unnamed protein product [Pleuronectes platessa]
MGWLRIDYKSGDVCPPSNDTTKKKETLESTGLTARAPVTSRQSGGACPCGECRMEGKVKASCTRNKDQEYVCHSEESCEGWSCSRASPETESPRRSSTENRMGHVEHHRKRLAPPPSPPSKRRARPPAREQTIKCHTKRPRGGAGQTYDLRRGDQCIIGQAGSPVLKKPNRRDCHVEAMAVDKNRRITMLQVAGREKAAPPPRRGAPSPSLPPPPAALPPPLPPPLPPLPPPWFIGVADREGQNALPKNSIRKLAKMSETIQTAASQQRACHKGENVPALGPVDSGTDKMGGLSTPPQRRRGGQRPGHVRVVRWCAGLLPAPTRLAEGR